MTKNVYRMFALSVALSPILGCQTSTPDSQQTTREVTSYTESQGQRHPGKADTKANGTITCTKASGKGSPACYVNTVAGGYQVLQKGASTTTGTGGPMTLTCMGDSSLKCAVDIKD